MVGSFTTLVQIPHILLHVATLLLQNWSVYFHVVVDGKPSFPLNDLLFKVQSQMDFLFSCYD